MHMPDEPEFTGQIIDSGPVVMHATTGPQPDEHQEGVTDGSDRAGAGE